MQQIIVICHTRTYRDETGIIYIHHDSEPIQAEVKEDNFIQIKNNAASLWTEISNKFKSYDNHLLFASYNEVDNC
ncbi:cellulase family glycosylhydrolase [Butyrivibrio sp. AE3004]|uniref:cellulase family glycosylhydrolase n=1 Tax=Butyrivibrio sp. AE3004 TaxID=1506994 RepID=UPI0012DBF74D